MAKHYLKTVQPFFSDVKNGTKTFELRRNDRNFQVGDVVCLLEYDAESQSLSGNQVNVRITYLLQDWPGLAVGFCIFSFVTELP